MHEIVPQQPPANKAEALELQEYQAITPEQEEAMQRIADIDAKLKTLDIIRNSVSKEFENGDNSFENPSLYSQEEAIGKKESELENALVEGGDPSQLKDELATMRATHAEYSEFYKNQGDTMFNEGVTRSGENKLYGKTEDQYSESIVALLDTLEGLGLSRERFVDFVNDGSAYDRVYEVRRVDSILNQFRSELMLQRNTERLGLPDGVVEMSAELTRSVGADKVDYKGLLYPHGKHRGQFAEDQVTVNQIFEALPFTDNEALSEYPTEVQDRFFEGVAKNIFMSTGDESQSISRDRVSALGKDLSELRIYGSERLRHSEDIDFEIKKFEKVLGYAKAEEDYLGACFKDDRTLTLLERLSDGGFQYDSARKEEWADRSVEWPVVPYNVRSDVNQTREKGGYRSKDFDAAGRFEDVMREALQTLHVENRAGKAVGAIDVIVAMRKATEKVKLELETVEAENEQLDMHSRYLDGLQNKKVTL